MSATEYRVVGDVIKMINDIKRNDVTIKYQNNNLEKDITSDLDGIKSLDHADGLNWYRLPWGALYGTKVFVRDVSEAEKIIEVSCKYIDCCNDGFVSREYYSKSFKRNNTASLNGTQVILDEFKKNMICQNSKLENKLYIIETGFDEGSRDYYVDGKYFYHAVVSENGIKGINQGSLVSLGTDKDIVDNGDLMNEQKIISLVKGE